jgi:HPt (histidine-containing phosphotransfer) domain-containing protein
MPHNTPEASSRHKSTLADHPDVKEVLPIFIGRLPVHVKRLRELVAAEDSSGLMMLAHQLRGAGKSYGFEGITTHAGAVEEHLAAGKPLSEGKALVAKLIHYIEHVEGFGDR